MIIGVIPARGGSVGVPRKNLRPVGNISLIRRAILFAQQVCDVVAVSSDDEEIIEQAISAGAFGVRRPSEISTSTSSSEDAIEHTLGYLFDKDQFSKHFRVDSNAIVGFIQATSPFQECENFAAGVAFIREMGSGYSTFSAVEDHSFLWEKRHNQTWIPKGHDKTFRKMRQDLPPTVKETGGFYQFKLDEFLSSRRRFSHYVQPIIVNPRYALDIDTEEDLEWANFLSPTIDTKLTYLDNQG